VNNTRGEHPGVIHDFMLDLPTGKVAYAIVSSGSFPGIGEKYHPLPLSLLEYATIQAGYVVSVTKDRLESAPMHDTTSQPDFDDRACGKRVHYFCGTTPCRAM